VPAASGRPNSIRNAMAPPKSSARAVDTEAATAVPRAAIATGRGRCFMVASDRHSPVTMPRWAALCCRTISITVDRVTIHNSV